MAVLRKYSRQWSNSTCLAMCTERKETWNSRTHVGLFNGKLILREVGPVIVHVDKLIDTFLRKRELCQDFSTSKELEPTHYTVELMVHAKFCNIAGTVCQWQRHSRKYVFELLSAYSDNHVCSSSLLAEVMCNRDSILRSKWCHASFSSGRGSPTKELFLIGKSNRTFL